MQMVKVRKLKVPARPPAALLPPHATRRPAALDAAQCDPIGPGRCSVRPCWARALLSATLLGSGAVRLRPDSRIVPWWVGKALLNLNLQSMDVSVSDVPRRARQQVNIIARQQVNITAPEPSCGYVACLDVHAGDARFTALRSVCVLQEQFEIRI